MPVKRSTSHLTSSEELGPANHLLSKLRSRLSRWSLLQPQLSLQIVTSLSDSLTAVSGEALNQNHPFSCSWISDAWKLVR